MDGTKTEMERLLKDAQKITGVKYDISNLSDVYNAIHVIQEKLKITGTTAEEAEKTISGSISSLKASWDNFLNGSGGINDVVYNFKNAVNNIMSAAAELIPKIIDSITQALPTLISSVITIVATIAKTILEK